MDFKPLELELNSWCNLQYSGFKLQELHDLIFLCNLIYILVYILKKSKPKEKIPTVLYRIAITDQYTCYIAWEWNPVPRDPYIYIGHYALKRVKEIWLRVYQVIKIFIFNHIFFTFP